MVYEVSPDIVSFDAERAVERAEAVAGDDLRVVAAMTSEDYDVMHVSDAVERAVRAEDADLERTAADLHRYETLVFFERRVFNELLPTAEVVSGSATFTDAGIVTRVVNDEDEGLFVIVERDVDVSALVDELEPIVVAT